MSARTPLERSAESPSFAARLGGEEFLVVLMLPIADAAMVRLEELRRQVAAQDWERVSPGLRVTVSIGATRLRDGDSQLTLLARADEHLYAAKQSGRDRTVYD